VGYDYPHDHASGFAPAQTHLPDELVGRRIYEPTRHGHEAAVADRLADLRQQHRRARAERRRTGRGGDGAGRTRAARTGKHTPTSDPDEDDRT
jgi:putative ATPase